MERPHFYRITVFSGLGALTLPACYANPLFACISSVGDVRSKPCCLLSFRVRVVPLVRTAQGIVEAGFDGACPRVRCMCCPRVVCEQAWAPLVEPDLLKTFQKRAATLLSIQVHGLT